TPPTGGPWPSPWSGPVARSWPRSRSWGSSRTGPRAPRRPTGWYRRRPAASSCCRGPARRPGRSSNARSPGWWPEPGARRPQVGPRLRAALRPTDTIARLGGDEFAVLLPTAGQDGARMVADRLAEAMDEPFEVDGIQLHVEASIGISVSHRGGRAETAAVEGL